MSVFTDKCRGGLSPIPATPDMQQPVGQRDGQLYTVGGNLPAVTVADNGKVLQVVGGVWTPVAFPNAQGVAV